MLRCFLDTPVPIQHEIENRVMNIPIVSMMPKQRMDEMKMQKLVWAVSMCRT
jgi:hypothetical protein